MIRKNWFSIGEKQYITITLPKGLQEGMQKTTHEKRQQLIQFQTRFFS